MMNGFPIAVERGKRFHAELKTADPAMAAQLLGAWKELIMGEMSQLTELANTDFESWAKESYEIAMKFAYQNSGRIGIPKGGKKGLRDGRGGSRLALVKGKSLQRRAEDLFETVLLRPWRG